MEYIGPNPIGDNQGQRLRPLTIRHCDQARYKWQNCNSASQRPALELQVQEVHVLQQEQASPRRK